VVGRSTLNDFRNEYSVVSLDVLVADTSSNAESKPYKMAQ